jgi:hypothetical protein
VRVDLAIIISSPENKNMKRIHALTFLLTAVVIAWSCGSSLKVSTDYDKSADFTKYKTFGLYNPENQNQAISQLNRNRIIEAIKAEMSKRGYVESSDAPDLLVNSTSIFQDRQSVSSTNTYMYGGMYRPYGWGPGVSSTNYDVRHYKDGSLVIDVVEGSSKKLLWQGTGNKEIDGPIKDPDTNIPKAVAMIMTDFPPGQAKKK